jgi:hypothetical protein
MIQISRINKVYCCKVPGEPVLTFRSKKALFKHIAKSFETNALYCQNKPIDPVKVSHINRGVFVSKVG